MSLPTKIIEINYHKYILEISYFFRPEKDKTILFLHGLGCAKNDFYGSVHNSDLNDYSLLAIDFPGCGNSPYPTEARFEIDDLVQITSLVINKLDLKSVVILGHSMSGLIGLLLAEIYPEKVEALVNVEGNLAGSDCFFSGKVAGMEREEFIGKAFAKYIHRVKINMNSGLQAYAKILQDHTNPAAMSDICPSLVEYSNEGDLLERFLNLKQPTQFIYGSQNNSLPYLQRLRNSNCLVNEISNSGHFPFYENAKEFYMNVAIFMKSLKLR